MGIDPESNTTHGLWCWLGRLAAGALLTFLTPTTASAQLAPAYGSFGDSVSVVSMVALSGRSCASASMLQCDLVTAVKDAGGNLKVIAWQDTGKAIVETGSQTAGAIVFNPGITAINSNTVVTAAFNSSFVLELISWQVASDGSIKRLKTLTTKQNGTSVAVTNRPLTSSCSCFATATSNPNLNVSIWNVNSSTGAITAGDAASGGFADRIAIVTSGSGTLFTALANSAGKLEVTGWSYSSGKLQRDDTGTAGTFQSVAATYLFHDDSSGTDYATTASIDNSGNLNVVLWFGPYGTAQAGSGMGGVASPVSGGKSVDVTEQGVQVYPVTAVRDQNGKLFLEAWRRSTLAEQGAQPTNPTFVEPYIEEYESSTDLAITDVAVASEAFLRAPLQPMVTHIVTASHNGLGKLEMRVFEMTQPLWSPYLEPFDLVWDMNNPDFNGRPLNPQWSYQLDHPGKLPDFSAICDGRNLSLLPSCTSQPTRWDLDTSAFVGFKNYCLNPGPFWGHLNWTIATYTGWVVWQDWSGNGTQDGDYNLLLYPTGLDGGEDKAGFATLNWSINGEYGMGLEFNDDETLDGFVTPWWQQLVNGAENGAQPTPDELFNGSTTAHSGPGLEAVVTGLIGIDGVHGAYVESHPVFALALRTQVTSVTGGQQEKWAFFLRNAGGEGGCSELTHLWPSSDNTYYIQLPWPRDANAFEGVVGETQVFGTDPRIQSSFSPSPGWTLLKVQFPADGQYLGAGNLLEGEFTLKYGLSAGHQAEEKRHAAVPSGEKEHDLTLEDVASSIPDATVRAKFTADTLNALKPLARPRIKVFPIKVDTTAKVEPRSPGAAGQGKSMPDDATPDPAKKQVNDALKKIMDTYRQQLPAAPSLKKPQS